MTLTQLNYIVAVDTHRHFATAAEKCYVTQPTLSMQISKLEKELDVLIFDRSKHPVVPTQIGRELIEQARIILKESEQLREISTRKEDELSGAFRVGVIPTIAPYLIPLFLKNFSSANPHVEITFEESITSELVTKLNNDDLDVIIIATPVKQNSIHEYDLYYEPFIAYLSREHELSERERLVLEDLDQSDLWLLNEGHCFRDQTVQLCKNARRGRNGNPIQFESGNLETLKKLVEQNYGMTLLPWMALNDTALNHDKVKTIEFENPVPRRKVRLAYSRLYLKRNIIQALVDQITEVIPDELKNSDESLILE